MTATVLLDSTSATAALGAAFDHGPGKSLWVPPQPPRTVAAPDGPGRSLRDLLSDIPPYQAPLYRALVATLAPRRWEPWNAHNDHRGYPSPRSLFLTDVVLRTAEHAWRLDPVRYTAVALDDPDAPPPEVGSVALDLYAYPARLPEGYGTLRPAVALLEAGHVAAALAEGCAAAGIATSAEPIGTGAYDGERVVRLRLGQTAAPSWPWRRVLAPRSAGLGPYGRLSADPRPIPVADWEAFLRTAHTQPPGSLAATPAGAALRHHILPRGDGTRALQDAFRYGPDVVDVAGMHAVWLIGADLAGTVHERGGTAYPATLLRAGAFAQHVCSAAAGAGLFCRPVRSFDEPAAEAAIGAASGEDAIYLLLIGRPRVFDFPYDLTDPEDHDDHHDS